MELRHYLFILENVASLCKVSHFAISATVYMTSALISKSTFLRGTGVCSEHNKRGTICHSFKINLSSRIRDLGSMIFVFVQPQRSVPWYFPTFIIA